MAKIAALIVAAGSGERFGGDVPKQYLEVGSKPILRHSIEAFSGIADTIQVVINPAHRELYDSAVLGVDLPEPVIGGSTRQQSVLNGLEALDNLSPEIVLIHDAARPFVDREIIERVIDALNPSPHRGEDRRGADFNETQTTPPPQPSPCWGGSAAIPVTPVTDTIKMVEDGEIISTLAREQLFAAQTPQGFHFRTILELHRKAELENLTFTDDSAICEHYGISVKAVEGSDKNFKVTTNRDLEKA